MAVNHAPGPDPLGEQRRAPGGEPSREPFDLPEARLLQQLPAGIPGLPDVRLPPRPQRLPAALLGDLRAARRGGVPGGERPRHLAQRAVHRRPRRHQRR